MIFFRKKKEDKTESPESLSSKRPPISMVAEERILTAEGWRRQMEKNAKKSRGKAQ